MKGLFKKVSTGLLDFLYASILLTLMLTAVDAIAQCGHKLHCKGQNCEWFWCENAK